MGQKKIILLFTLVCVSVAINIYFVFGGQTSQLSPVKNPIKRLGENPLDRSIALLPRLEVEETPNVYIDTGLQRNIPASEIIIDKIDESNYFRLTVENTFRGYESSFKNEKVDNSWAPIAETDLYSLVYKSDIYNDDDIRNLTCKSEFCKMTFSIISSDPHAQDSVIFGLGQIIMRNSSNIPESLKGMSAKILEKPDSDLMEIYYQRRNEKD
jgi:hypothetical protein